MGVEVEDFGEVLWAAEEALDSNIDLEDFFVDSHFGVADEVVREVAEGFGGFGAEGEREGASAGSRDCMSLKVCLCFVQVGEDGGGWVALL